MSFAVDIEYDFRPVEKPSLRLIEGGELIKKAARPALIDLRDTDPALYHKKVLQSRPGLRAIEEKRLQKYISEGRSQEQIGASMERLARYEEELAESRSITRWSSAKGRRAILPEAPTFTPAVLKPEIVEATQETATFDNPDKSKLHKSLRAASLVAAFAVGMAGLSVAGAAPETPGYKGISEAKPAKPSYAEQALRNIGIEVDLTSVPIEIAKKYFPSRLSLVNPI